MEATELKVESGQSAGIEKVSAALVAAQGEMTNPPKTKTVYAGQKKYSFAPLPEIIDAVRPVLKKHGLAVVQLVRERILETRLIHTSGQWIGAAYSLPGIADSQAMGSAISYARRYCLCAILGIAGEDDEDGEAATAAEQAESDAKRKEAEKRLDALKAKGQVRSAYDGKVLAPGEAALPAARETTDHRLQTSDPNPGKAGSLAGNAETSDQRPQTSDRGTKAPVPARGKEEGRQGAAGTTEPEEGDGGVAARSAPPTGSSGSGQDGWSGIAGPLAELMRREGLTAAALKKYYVGKGHLPESVEPTALPADYVAGLIKPENWKKAVTAIKGGK